MPKSAISPTDARFLDPTDKLRELRLSLLMNGYAPLPLSGKKCRINNWSNLEIDRDEILAWGPLSHLPNTGLRCGDIAGIDIDVEDPWLVNILVAETRLHLDNTPLERIGRSPRSLLPYRASEYFSKRTLAFEYKGCDHKIEILAKGQYFAAYGMHPETKKEFKWLGERNPLNTPIDELPSVTKADIEQYLLRVEDVLKAKGATNIQRHPKKSVAKKVHTRINRVETGRTIHLDYLQAALEYLDADEHDEWIHVGMGIHYETNGSSAGLELWDEWSRNSGKYDETRENECEYRWESFNGSADPVTGASIIYAAKKNGFNPSQYTGPKELRSPATARLEKRPQATGHSNRTSEYQHRPEFPAKLMVPPGLVGSIAKYCNRASFRDQPLLDICAGLMTVTTLTENRYEVERFHTPLNIYVVAVAETGEGKEAPRKAIKSLLKEVNRLSIVKESASSAPAILRSIASAARSNLTLLTDEFGRFLSAASRPNNGHQYELVSEYMRLYGQANSTHVGRVYADKNDNIPSIDRPFVNIFGTTTERSLTDALSNKDVVDGHLNRMLIVHTNSRTPEFKDPDPFIDEDLRRHMSNLLLFDELEFNEESVL